MSENQIPTSGDESSFTPPPPPASGSPAQASGLPAQASGLPAQPVPPAPQPTQSHPGAVPSWPQTGYAPPPAQPGYGTPPAQPGYGAPPAQPGYAPYGTPGYPVATPRPTSGLALTSLICGIAGLILVWAVVPLAASIAAVITGHMALTQVKRDPRMGGRGSAIAGLILGYIAIGIGAFTVISTLLSFLFVGAFSLPFLFSR